MAKRTAPPVFDWPHTIDDAVSAQIISWERRIGVEYIYRNGHRDAHQVTAADWPVIRKLKRAGDLSYQSDEVREGMGEIFRLGLDH